VLRLVLGAGAVCERGDVAVELVAVVLVAAPAAGLLAAAFEAGVLPEDWSDTFCDGSVAVGILPLDGWRGVVVVWPSALNARKNQIILRKARTATNRKIKYLFFSFIKKITFAKRSLILWLTKVFTNSYPTIALKRFRLLKIIKPIMRRSVVPAPGAPAAGIITTLLMVVFPLLALTIAPARLTVLPDPTQDTVRRAGQANTQRETTPDTETDVPTENLSNQLRTVVLDAGHGGKDPGTHGRYVKEKNINLDLILQLGRKIKAHHPNIRVIYTRSSDQFVDLYERGAIANRNRADLFISIHCNASPSSSRVYGTETYTLGLHRTQSNLDVARRENAVILQEKNYQQTYKGFNPNSPLATIMLANYQHAFMASSINFAEKVERSFRRNAERKSNGVKQAGFIVLWKTTMPSILIESGYLTNPAEEQYLKSDEGQEQIAGAIYKAFALYKDEIETAN
jgi:N-acetylmuramoyl-L-alanine amidase